MKRQIKFIIRLLISVILFTVLIYLTGPKQIYNELVNSNINFNLLGFVFIFLGTLIAVYRWYLVMLSIGFKQISFSFYFYSYFRGIFFNQILPSSIGGDTIKVLDVAKKAGCKKREAIVGVLVDRGLGIAGILFLNLVFNNIEKGFLPASTYYILNIITIGGIIGFVIFMFLHKIIFLNKYNWYKILSIPSLALYNVMNSRLKSILQIFLTLIIHMCTFTGVYFISRAFGVELPLSAYMVIMPPVILLTIIPISLAGWGVREVSMVSLLGYSGIAQELSLSISIIFGFCYVIQGLLGMLFFINYKMEK